MLFSHTSADDLLANSPLAYSQKGSASTQVKAIILGRPLLDSGIFRILLIHDTGGMSFSFEREQQNFT